MLKLFNTLKSQVSIKYINGFTGALLLMFIVVHFVGNMQLFIGEDAFNGYAYKLESLGLITWILELGLVGIFLLHAISGVTVYFRKLSKRPIKYAIQKSAGGKSKQTFSSNTMIVTGSLMLIFLILHVATMKFGLGAMEEYITTLHNMDVKDLNRWTIENFQNINISIAYIVIMILLGFHLRHGFWSAFQSLGLMNDKYSKFVYIVALIFAVFVAFGFILIPIWAFFTGGISLVDLLQ